MAKLLTTQRTERGAPARCDDLSACPFCGVKPQEHDGDYVVIHAASCFFTQQYAQEMWLIGKRLKDWQRRQANGPDQRPAR